MHLVDLFKTITQRTDDAQMHLMMCSFGNIENNQGNSKILVCEIIRVSSFQNCSNLVKKAINIPPKAIKFT